MQHLEPDTEAYLLALRELGVAADEALAVDDSAVRLRAARAAGIATIVVTNGHAEGQDFRGAALVVPAFDGPEPVTAQRCRAVHGRWWAAAPG